MRPHYIPWIIFWIPLIAVHGAYFMGLWEGVAYQCNPYIHGCTTISRAAREGNAIFLFRGLMMPIAALLVIFWYLQSIWLEQLRQTSQRYLFAIGAISALFLVLYVNFLGTDGDFNRFLRRYGVVFYFGLTVLAQILSLASLNKLGEKVSKKLRVYMNAQLGFIAICWLLAMANLVSKQIGFANEKEIENVIEWFFALFMSLYFPFAALMWKHSGFQWRFKTNPTQK
ncbi:MAG: hypothetical protein LAT53_02695 [Idiomarina sp.]|nr:hypothetical protein [Idiomarina sp.]